MSKSLKIAITGKGGVGKTTLAAALAHLFTADHNVLAVDADPDANLGSALGFTEMELARVTPIAEMSELIAERTGAGKTNYGKFFKINPKVSDIPERFSIEKNGVKLLVMGTVETGGGGCVCPEHVMLKRVISHLVLGEDDVVIMDMEAGIEHLGRGTAGMVDRFIVVVEPGARSLQTFGRIRSLAADLGVGRVSAIGNKITCEADKAFITEKIREISGNVAGEVSDKTDGNASDKSGDIGDKAKDKNGDRTSDTDLLGFISYGKGVMDADRAGESALFADAVFAEEIKAIKKRLEAIG